MLGGVAYAISYHGGSGNDVTLTDDPSPHAADDNFNATESTTKSGWIEEDLALRSYVAAMIVFGEVIGSAQCQRPSTRSKIRC
jgi:hypothetical protein